MNASFVRKLGNSSRLCPAEDFASHRALEFGVQCFQVQWAPYIFEKSQEEPSFFPTVLRKRRYQFHLTETHFVSPYLLVYCVVIVKICELSLYFVVIISSVTYGFCCLLFLRSAGDRSSMGDIASISTSFVTDSSTQIMYTQWLRSTE